MLRVQGRYADSDAACRDVARAGAALYASAFRPRTRPCGGETASDAPDFETISPIRGLAAGTRGWLTTSLAELEERDGRAAAADAAYRSVLKLGPDTYAAIAYADFLIAQRQPRRSARGAERRSAHRHGGAAPGDRRDAGARADGGARR